MSDYSELPSLPNLNNLQSELVRTDKLALLDAVVSAFEVGVLADDARHLQQSTGNPWEAALTRMDPACDAFLQFREDAGLSDSPLQPSLVICGSRIMVGTWINLTQEAVKLNKLSAEAVEEKAGSLCAAVAKNNQNWKTYLTSWMDALQPLVHTEKRKEQARAICGAIDSPMEPEAIRNKFSAIAGLRL